MLNDDLQKLICHEPDLIKHQGNISIELEFKLSEQKEFLFKIKHFNQQA